MDIMETITLDQDIKTFYLTAKSFPEGILDAHKQLHALVPFATDRKYFGLSRPEKGTIVYRAATEEKKPGEAEKYQCATLILKKGKYITLILNDYRKDPQSIQKAFQQLLASPGLDPQGYCVEWNLNNKDAVKWMVRLQE